MNIDHQQFATIDSTNKWARRNLGSLDSNKLTLITAQEQTAGTGTHKRHWVSPSEKNIYATFVWFLQEPFEQGSIGQVTHLMALSICQVLESLGFEPKIKWPNDLLLNGKKCAGILCESIHCSDSLAIICGIGLNVNMTLEELSKIDRPATSLFVECGEPQSVEMLIQSLLNVFTISLNIFLKEGFASFFDSFRKRFLFQLDDKITIHYNGSLLNGKFISLNKDGSLSIKLIGGKLKTIHSGECV